MPNQEQRFSCLKLQQPVSKKKQTNNFQNNDFKITVESGTQPLLTTIITSTTIPQNIKHCANFDSIYVHERLSKTTSCQDQHLVLKSKEVLNEQQCLTSQASTTNVNKCKLELSSSLKTRQSDQKRFASFCSKKNPDLYLECLSSIKLIHAKSYQNRLNSLKLKEKRQQKRFSNIEIKTKFGHKNKEIMLSLRSATWTIVLVQLVLSAAALIASVSIVSAQAQSISRFGVPQKPRL